MSTPEQHPVPCDESVPRTTTPTTSTTTTTTTTTTTAPTTPHKSKYQFDTKGFTPIQIPPPTAADDKATIDHDDENHANGNNADDNGDDHQQQATVSFWSSFATTVSNGFDHAVKKTVQALDELSSTANETTNAPTQPVIIEPEMPTHPLFHILQCTWCSQVISKPVTISCGHSVCFGCFNEMYACFNPEAVTNPGDDIATAVTTSKPHRTARNVKIAKYDGVLECPICATTSRCTQPPSINIMLNQVLDVYHLDLEDVKERREIQRQQLQQQQQQQPQHHHQQQQQQIPTPTQSQGTPQHLSPHHQQPQQPFIQYEHHDQLPPPGLSPSLMVTDLPRSQPVQEIILNLDDDMGPNHNQDHRDSNNGHDNHPNGDQNNETIDHNNDNNDPNDKDEHDLVSRFRNATIAGIMSIEKAFGSESSNNDADDDGNDDDKKRVTLSPNVDLRLTDAELAFDQGAYQ